jgi:hypothetical protein
MTTPAGPGVIVPSGLDIKGLFTAYDASFRMAVQGDNSTLYQKLAFIPSAADMQAAGEPRQGVNSAGQACQFLRFPFPMISGAPEDWDWGKPREETQAKIAYVELELKRKAPKDEKQYYDLLNAPIFGMIRNNLNLMLDRAPKVWDYMLADAIIANANAYDGIPFFTPAATPHPANSGETVYLPSGQPATFYNDIQIGAINVPNLRTAVNLLETVPGFDGQPLDTGTNTRILAIAPNSDIEMQLRDVFFGTIQAQSLNAASAATGPNEGLRGKADVMLWKDLRRGTPVGIKSGLTADKVFYLMSKPTNIQQALIVVPMRQPTPHYAGLDPTHPYRVEQGGIRYGWYVFGGAQLALPQRMIRVQITG